MFKGFTILVPGRQIPRPHVQVDYQKKEEKKKERNWQCLSKERGEICFNTFNVI